MQCHKWRRLPFHIRHACLSEQWKCSLAHWLPSKHASCSAPEEVEEATTKLGNYASEQDKQAEVCLNPDRSLNLNHTLTLTPDIGIVKREKTK